MVEFMKRETIADICAILRGYLVIPLAWDMFVFAGVLPV